MTEPQKMTDYFREQVLRKRAYLKIDWCLSVIRNPDSVAIQEDKRIRFWGFIDELQGKALRVVTLEDGETLHNAFPDSGYTRRNR